MTPFELCIIVLIALMILTINNKQHNIFINSQKEKEKHKLEKETVQNLFNEGAGHMWRMIQVSLFKLYKEYDIMNFADFDSQVKSIVETMNNFLANTSDMEKWNENLNKYFQDKNEGL